MRKIVLTFWLLTPLASLLAGSTESVQTAEGVLKITPVTHGSLMLEFKGRVIHIDPWGRGDYTGLPKADLILITDIHGDHLDPVQVKKLTKGGTRIVAPQAVAQTVTEAMVLHNGQKKVVAGLQIEAVPMYNHKRGPSPGNLYHDQGKRQRIRADPGRQEGLHLGRHRLHSGNEGFSQHRYRLHNHEPALHHAARGSSRVRRSLPAQNRLSLPLPRLRPERFQPGTGGPPRHRSQDKRLVLDRGPDQQAGEKDPTLFLHGPTGWTG